MMQPLARFNPAAYRGLGTSMDQPLAVDRRVVVVNADAIKSKACKAKAFDVDAVFDFIVIVLYLHL